MKAIKGMPMFSHVKGNEFAKAIADPGGDYEKAKAMLEKDVATMKIQYGTGSPTTLKEKVKSVQSEGFKNKSVVSPQQGEYSYKGKKYRRDVDPGTQLKISARIAKDQLANK